MPPSAHPFRLQPGLRQLADGASQPARAARVHDALASMSPAVLEVRGLAAVRDRLLRWLAARSVL